LFLPGATERIGEEEKEMDLFGITVIVLLIVGGEDAR
jgi:hypothetical protein